MLKAQGHQIHLAHIMEPQYQWIVSLTMVNSIPSCPIMLPHLIADEITVVVTEEPNMDVPGMPSRVITLNT